MGWTRFLSKRLGAGLLLSLSLASLVMAQAGGKPSGRAAVPTLTLYMKQFGELESRLLDAQAGKDLKQLDTLLSPLFELRRAEGGATPRQTWLEEQLRQPEFKAKRISHLVVFETGAHAVANFRLSDEQGRERFIVDVWAPASEGQWLLRARFDSPVSAKP